MAETCVDSPSEITLSSDERESETQSTQNRARSRSRPPPSETGGRREPPIARLIGVDFSDQLATAQAETAVNLGTQAVTIAGPMFCKRTNKYIYRVYPADVVRVVCEPHIGSIVGDVPFTANQMMTSCSAIVPFVRRSFRRSDRT